MSRQTYNTKIILIMNKKHAENLLLQVRFPLLSDYALKYILNKTSSFWKINECRIIIDDMLKHKRNFIQESRNCFINRYCSDNLYSIFIRGKNLSALYTIGKVKEVDQSSLKYSKMLGT